jgi:hypothetical protein
MLLAVGIWNFYANSARISPAAFCENFRHRQGCKFVCCGLSARSLDLRAACVLQLPDGRAHRTGLRYPLGYSLARVQHFGFGKLYHMICERWMDMTGFTARICFFLLDRALCRWVMHEINRNLFTNWRAQSINTSYISLLLRSSHASLYALLAVLRLAIYTRLLHPTAGSFPR